MKIRNIAVIGTCAALASSLLCACSFELPVNASDMAEYSVGDAVIEEKVESLDIDWSSGVVTVETRPGDTVEIIETTSQELPDSKRVHWLLDGTTLRIIYSSPVGMNIMTGEKDLTVRLPESVPLSYLKTDVSSAYVTITGITADAAEIGASSGRINGELAAKKLNASASSGDMDITLSGDCESAGLHASSGKITLRAANVGSIEADTSSGAIEIYAESVEDLDASTSSGGVRAFLETAPAKADIHASSGNVELYMPENADFTLDVDTGSGDVSWDVPLKRDGDRYVSGDGSGSIKIDTSSGNVRIGKI